MITRLENGQHTILLDRVYALAHALGVPVAELFQWDDNPSGNPSQPNAE
jgi:transcriptional regulator with XRE-family HTH domain